MFPEAMTLWDPDGSGIQQPRVVLAGSRTFYPGAEYLSGFFARDPFTGKWSQIASKTDGFVLALVANEGGALYVGGEFQHAGSQPAENVAAWIDGEWHPLGLGVTGPGYVLALACYGDDELVAGGSFLTAGGVSALRVAKWDGLTWTPMGTGLAGWVRCLETLPNGDVIAAGDFVSAGTVIAKRVAKWDGTKWSALGSGLDNPSVRALAVSPSGELIAGALSIFVPGGTPMPTVSRWDGFEWHQLGTSLNPTYSSNNWASHLVFSQDGSLLVGGAFSGAGLVESHNIIRWNGEQWSSLASGVNGEVRSLVELPSGEVLAGGPFSKTAFGSIGTLASWDGSQWNPATTDFDNSIFVVVATNSGRVIVGGFLERGGGVSANNLVLWDGHSWSAFGTGPGDGYGESPFAVIELHNGDVVAGGNFFKNGPQQLKNIARWDGQEWHSMGSPQWIFSLVETLDHEVIAGGAWYSGPIAPHTGVARWDGSEWLPVGKFDIAPYSLALDPKSGRVVAGGVFQVVNGLPMKGIVEWDGDAWNHWWGSQNPAKAQVSAMSFAANGDLYLSGNFEFEPGKVIRFLRWDGANYHEIDITGAVVDAIGVLSNGDVVVGGDFDSIGGVQAASCARWDGQSWHEFAGGVDGSVNSVAVLPNDSVAIGGGFSHVGGLYSPRFAIVGCTDCYADCDSSGTLDFFDLMCFQDAFVTQQPQADCDKDGEISVIDFVCFLSHFDGGCPWVN